MPYEQRDNSGSLFKNERKAQPNHADYNGTIMVNGVTYWLNAWIKKGQKGTFMSLSVKPKEQVRQEARQQSAPRTQQQKRDEMDDSIPF